MVSRAAPTDQRIPQSPTPGAAFELKDVEYSYEGKEAALFAVSLAVQQGERVAILGANGSGKSTLLRLMNGLAFASAGTVQAFGEPLTEAALADSTRSFRFRRRVGFVFQNADAQLFSSTVREELAFGPLHMGLPLEEVERRVTDLARMFGLERLLDRSPYRLSGGEKRKVAIASVLAANPDALLLDEPTAGLDPRSQRWLIDLLVQLHRAGKTLVTATHDLDTVAEIADRVVVLNEAHTVLAAGPTTEILQNGELLLSANLIHEHTHWHGSLCHSHPHHHGGDHDHEH